MCKTVTRNKAHHTEHQNCLEYSNHGAYVDALVCSFQQVSVTRRTHKDAATFCIRAARRHCVHHLKQPQQHVTRQTSTCLGIGISTRPDCNITANCSQTHNTLTQLLAVYTAAASAAAAAPSFSCNLHPDSLLTSVLHKLFTYLLLSHSNE